MGCEKQQETAFPEQDLIVFPEGLFGFEAYKKFLPLEVDEGNDSMLCLQSVEEEHLSFLMMNPFYLDPDYDPALSETEKDTLKADCEEDLAYYVICVIKEPPEESTVNLKCPVVVNIHTRQARQVVLDSGEYGMRHKLGEFSDKEGA